jgi:hypothetical protein
MQTENGVLLDKITAARIKIGELITRAIWLKNSAETTLAWRNLQMAQGWLFKLNTKIGSATKTLEDRGAADAVALADRADELQSIWADIGIMVSDFEADLTEEVLQDSGPLATLYGICLIKCLTEARFCYGLELNDLKV